ncbi:MAG: ABC-F family ATP-binding cassette domain-containing protein [Bacteroidales bacterium]|nr:ABC-F family ATP-binding cassette domain-containing protein [Bacteroidales bacterium]MDD5975022.1 ABC-F family ATP-binding cassette domain-containing protein [Bacteroidales bacterium]
MAKVYLQVENLTKSYGFKCLFENISFGIDQGQRVSIIAPNGTGKSTLLKIISGKEIYDSGKITFNNDIRIGYLPQEPDFPNDITIIESCFTTKNEVTNCIKEYERLIDQQQIGLENDAELQKAIADMDRLDAWNYESKIKQILGKLDLHNLSQPINELSGGQKKRLALGNVLITQPDFILLDEPTNHLDLEMIEWLEDFLNHSKMTILMVTHDRYFLDNVCSNIIELDNNTLYQYKGNYNYYLEKREERIANFNAETLRVQNLYRKELDWIRRQPQARGHKAQYRIDAFKEIEERAKKRIQEKQVTLGVKSAYIGSKIFEAQYINKSFDDKIILKDFYYNFSRYEKLGIIGNNGTGKSTFIKLLLGEIEPDSGKFDIGDTIKFAYFSQNGIDFNPGTKVIDAVRNIAEEITLGNGKKLSASQFLNHFLFSPEKQHNYIENLSGGEKRRLYLCTILIKAPNFLILDEPTNDLDITTLNILEDYLINFKGCVIVISHDRYFMDKIVDHILIFHGNGNIQDFPGNYTDYREWKELKEAEKRDTEKSKPSNTIKKLKSSNSNNKPKLSFKEKKEMETLENELSILEETKKNIENELSITSDTDKIINLSKQYEETNNAIDIKTNRLLELYEIQ